MVLDVVGCIGGVRWAFGGRRKKPDRRSNLGATVERGASGGSKSATDDDGAGSFVVRGGSDDRGRAHLDEIFYSKHLHLRGDGDERHRLFEHEQLFLAV